MQKLIHTILGLLIFSSVALAQPRFSKADFAVGKVAVDANVESILPSLGKPVRSDLLKQ